MVSNDYGDVNLTEYILERALSKSDADSRFNQVDLIIESLKNKELFEIVTHLPSEDIEVNKLYLVYTGDRVTGNFFDVFLYVNGEWEQLDSLPFNLNDYYKKVEVDGLVNGKAERSDLQTLQSSLTNLQSSINNSITTIRSTITTIQGNITDAQEDITELITDVDGDSTQTPVVKGLKTELNETIASLELTKTSLNTAKVDIISLQNANTSFNTRITALENNSSSGTVEIDFDEEFEDVIDRLLQEQNGE